MESAFTIGIDLGDKRSDFAVLAEDGEVVQSGKLLTKPREFERVFASFKGSVVALEAGSQSRWASKLLQDLGLEVYVANPRQLGLIYGSVDKDDRTDAERLARLVRFDKKLLCPITHRDESYQDDLEVLKARKVLVDSRTAIVNHVRGVLKSSGITVQGSNTETFASHAREVVPESQKAAIEPLLRMLEELTDQIREYGKQIESLCRGKYRQESEIVRQVNGVGPVTGLTYILTLGDVSRFRKSRDVGAWLGLRPKRSESGDSAPELRITKAGDVMLRSLLVQSAHYILGPFGKDCYLRQWGLKKAEGGKRAKKRAVVAVARKLAVLLHRLLKTGETYDPLRGLPQPRSEVEQTIIHNCHPEDTIGGPRMHGRVEDGLNASRELARTNTQSAL